MPSPILAQLDTEVTEATTVMASAAILIRGISTRITAAVAAAVANGATEAELAPVAQLVTALDASANDLASAVTENTPAA